MKTLYILITITILSVSPCFASAEQETGDTRARPITCYGTESDGSITAILVDSDGKVQLA